MLSGRWPPRPRWQWWDETEPLPLPFSNNRRLVRTPTAVPLENLNERAHEPRSIDESRATGLGAGAGWRLRTGTPDSHSHLDDRPRVHEITKRRGEKHAKEKAKYKNNVVERRKKKIWDREREL